jgi:hypothetical protein
MQYHELRKKSSYAAFCAVGRLEMGRFESRTFCAVGFLVPWDV